MIANGFATTLDFLLPPFEPLFSGCRTSPTRFCIGKFLVDAFDIAQFGFEDSHLLHLFRDQHQGTAANQTK